MTMARVPKKLLYIILAIIAAVVGYLFEPQSPSSSLNKSTTTTPSTQDDVERLLAHAYKNQLSDLQVQGVARVHKLLPDDNKGSRHQRFIIKFDSGLSVLVAHNIDLAPRLNNLKAGDMLGFNGEYEWNDRGGVLHWTHRDPAGRHAHGWLELNGKRYQ
jgi:hypothetical protein